METITLKNPINLVAKQVKTFPEGISQAFDNLWHTLPDSAKRAYYGISWMEDNRVVYYAAAEQIGNTELKDQAFEPWTIESGEYIALPVRQWREKTDTIKDVFCLLMQDARADKSKPCVEWYKTDDEMLCMIKTTSN